MRSVKGPEIVPATAELLERFWGALRPQTVRGVVAVLDGEPICVAGVYFDGSKMCAFADVLPQMRRYRKAGVRMGHQFVEVLRAVGLPTFALADCNQAGADRLLLHLGFVRAEPQTRPELFIWQT